MVFCLQRKTIMLPADTRKPRWKCNTEQHMVKLVQQQYNTDSSVILILYWTAPANTLNYTGKPKLAQSILIEI